MQRYCPYSFRSILINRYLPYHRSHIVGILGDQGPDSPCSTFSILLSPSPFPVRLFSRCFLVVMYMFDYQQYLKEAICKVSCFLPKIAYFSAI